MDNNRVLNANVAERIGLTISGVSRIRNANRHPHPLTMRNIYQQYGWDIYDQFERAHYGKRDDYAKKVEEVLAADQIGRASWRERGGGRGGRGMLEKNRRREYEI